VLLSTFGFLQAYTLELEDEVAKLKELNKELQRKQVCSFLEKKFLEFGGRQTCLTKSWLLQAEIFEMQKNQVWASLLELLPFTLNILGYVFRTIAACIFGWGIIVSWNCHLLCLYP
jgi:ABA responsive element binding factor